MSKKQSHGSAQKLVWRIVISTLIVFLIVTIAAKLLPSAFGLLTEYLNESLKYFDSPVIHG